MSHRRKYARPLLTKIGLLSSRPCFSLFYNVDRLVGASLPVFGCIFSSLIICARCIVRQSRSTIVECRTRRSVASKRAWLAATFGTIGGWQYFWCSSYLLTDTSIDSNRRFRRPRTRIRSTPCCPQRYRRRPALNGVAWRRAVCRGARLLLISKREHCGTYRAGRPAAPAKNMTVVFTDA